MDLCGEFNQQPDYLSVIMDDDNGYVNPAVFAWLESTVYMYVGSLHTVDRFAKLDHGQVPCFHSRFWNPGSKTVDTVTTDWSGENNWWWVPVNLVPRVTGHGQVCMAEGGDFDSPKVEVRLFLAAPACTLLSSHWQILF